ncbi:MAG: hypothetical protein ACRDN0_10390, partial [Trebonia sp.]
AIAGPDGPDGPDGPAGRAWHWKAGGTAVTEGFVRGAVHASYLHTHWNGIPGIADRVTAAARRHLEARTSACGH